MPSGKITISVGGTFDELAQKVGTISNEVVARGADKILGSFGSEIRKTLGEKQEEVFHLGSLQTKSYNSVRISHRAKWNSQHGWYTASDGRRITGFEYENAAYKKASKKSKRPITVIGSASTGYVYSLIHNLWGHATKKYDNDSPYFNGGWYGKKFGFWKEGYSRPAKRTFFNESTVNEAVNPTMQRAEGDLQKLLKENGF